MQHICSYSKSDEQSLENRPTAGSFFLSICGRTSLEAIHASKTAVYAVFLVRAYKSGLSSIHKKDCNKHGEEAWPNAESFWILALTND